MNDYHVIKQCPLFPVLFSFDRNGKHLELIGSARVICYSRHKSR